jgi:electron transfer flavoprotein beta subunit
MKIGVLLKQVPGSESKLAVNQDGNWVEEDTLNFEMNESDSYALEEALQIYEKNGSNGEVVVMSLGPERTPKVIREALAKGAHRGIHIVDTMPYETDPFLIASIFSKIVQETSFDLVLAGLQSDDLGTGQTGVILGELCGMSTATLIMETELQDNKIRVKRELESGWFQWMTMHLPACIMIQSGINQPRYASLKGIMGAKKKEIRTISKADLLPTTGPLQAIDTLYIQKKDAHTQMLEGDPDEVVSELVNIFKTDIKVL